MKFEQIGENFYLKQTIYFALFERKLLIEKKITSRYLVFCLSVCIFKVQHFVILNLVVKFTSF